jgi:hypothetical protein
VLDAVAPFDVTAILPAPDVVAIFNTSEDTIDMLRVVLEQASCIVVAAFTHYLRDGKLDFEHFMQEHQPGSSSTTSRHRMSRAGVCFSTFTGRPACRDVPFVVTTNNASQVRSSSVVTTGSMKL